MINILKWEPSKVSMAQLFIGDPVEKIKDAIANSSDADLLAAYGAVNRLVSGFCDADEIEHYRTKKILMENALTIRLRAARAAA
jgi:uncharacterized protein YjaG (DUF416 family)